MYLWLINMGNLCIEIYDFEERILKPRVHCLGHIFIFIFLRNFNLLYQKEWVVAESRKCSTFVHESKMNLMYVSLVSLHWVYNKWGHGIWHYNCLNIFTVLSHRRCLPVFSKQTHRMLSILFGSYYVPELMIKWGDILSM